MPTTTDRVLGSSNGQYDVVFTDKKDNSQMDQSDFLKLMVAQMQNQDFTNPTDNTDMINQMVQFSNMQMMQQMASYSKTNYAMSLVGKTVTASRFNVSGNLDSTTGTVQKVSLVDNEYVLYVGGKKYALDQIMSIGGATTGDESSIDPTGYPLKVSGATQTSATLEWPTPTEDELEASSLKFSVYYSTEGPFDTVAEVEKGVVASGIKDQKGVYKTEVTGLNPGERYYVNVVVTDAAGKKSVYKPGIIRTLS